MTTEEKILLVQLILEDIRGSWNDSPEDRTDDAKELCYELVSYNKYFECMAEVIERYIENCKYGDNDGRYFRDRFPYGYEGMGKLHKLSKTYKDKSKEFNIAAFGILTNPKYRFDDMD